MGYALMYLNLLLYICAHVYPQNDAILENTVSEYSSPEGSVSYLHHMNLRNGLNLRATPLAV